MAEKTLAAYRITTDGAVRYALSASAEGGSVVRNEPVTLVLPPDVEIAPGKFHDRLSIDGNIVTLTEAVECGMVHIARGD